MANFGRSTYIAWGNLTLDLINIDSGMSAHTDAIDTTRYGGVTHEFEPGYTDYGGITVTVGTDRTADVTAMLRAYSDHTKGTLSIVTPVGRQITFSAFMTDLSHVLDKNGLYTLQITFKFSGAPVYTEYTGYSILPEFGTIMYYGCSYGLFLAGNGVDFGGGTVNWQITSTGHAGDTKIVGNTLIIAATETQGSINIKANFRPIMELAQPLETTYVIRPPPVSSIKLNGKNEIILPPDGDATIEVTYSITAYPIGGTLAAKYELYYGEQKVTDPSKGIKINENTGKLTITQTPYEENYPDHSASFEIRAHSAYYEYVKDALRITIVNDHEHEQ